MTKETKPRSGRAAPARPRPGDRPGAASGRARTPGRPAAASPELRPRLLDAALACYVRDGIAASSLRAIAREAGVTPALLHYYFGDAQQLREAVVEERVLPAVGVLRESLPPDAGDVAALVAAFVGGVARLVERFPWLPALWVREVLCEGGQLRGLLLERVGPQLPVMLAQRFAQAQRDGVFNPDLDPRLAVVSLIGLTFFPAASAPIWRSLFQASDIDAEALRAHTIALLDRGLGAG
ncbi:MAG: TetR family transcriptional regulator [Dokdonella sp.]|uniref:TetR family transcriptional regulator n=1 Tax=Dokdonella sp. TaxID=2291710 RepID=UPI003F8092CF